MKTYIYHFVDEEAWDEAQSTKLYEHPTLKTENFIHCSEAGQVPGVYERYYSDRAEKKLLKIDSALLSSKLQYDMAKSVQQEFPHIYGPLNLSAVVQVIDYSPGLEL